MRGLTFPLLADFEPKEEIARRYQVWRAGDGFSERALYLVDGDGIIRYSHISSKLERVPDRYELHRALDEMRSPERPAAPAAEGVAAGRRS